MCCHTPQSADFCRQAANASARALQSNVGAAKMAPAARRRAIVHHARFEPNPTHSLCAEFILRVAAGPGPPVPYVGVSCLSPVCGDGGVKRLRLTLTLRRMVGGTTKVRPSPHGPSDIEPLHCNPCQHCRKPRSPPARGALVRCPPMQSCGRAGLVHARWTGACGAYESCRETRVVSMRLGALQSPPSPPRPPMPHGWRCLPMPLMPSPQGSKGGAQCPPAQGQCSWMCSSLSLVVLFELPPFVEGRTGASRAMGSGRGGTDRREVTL